MNSFYSQPIGGYGFHGGRNIINSMVGRPFFYNDAEVGIGWESKIDQIFVQQDRTGYVLELSCGTRVEICEMDIMKDFYKAFTTNLKD